MCEVIVTLHVADPVRGLAAEGACLLLELSGLWAVP